MSNTTSTESLDSRVAVLIDADNTPYDQVRQILDISAKYGRLVIKRAYGDWSKDNLQPWSNACDGHAIRTVQQNRYIKSKNASDAAMIIDAMDMLHHKQVDSFVLVTSDSDFTCLATRLREDGCQVFGIGRRTTPPSFVKGCDRFSYLDGEDGRSVNGKPGAAAVTGKTETGKGIGVRAEGKELLIRALKLAMDESGTVKGARLSAMLTRIEPSFSPTYFGVKKLSDFVNLYPELVEATGRKSGQDPLYRVKDGVLFP